MKDYSPHLNFADHFSTYWRRKERLVDLITRWVPVVISIIALIVSILSYSDSHKNKASALNEVQIKAVTKGEDVPYWKAAPPPNKFANERKK